MYNLWKYPDAHISDLIGKTIVEIRGMEKGNGTITFTCSDGSTYYMYHEQDCCESVYIEDVIGDVDRLLNNPILMAEERTSHDNQMDDSDESFTWTFYALATVKGYVDLRWYGTSNGYYSESVDFKKIN